MQRSYAATLFTTLLLSVTLTACGGEKHEQAIDKVAEAEELAKANAPKITLDEPATIQADTVAQEESDPQENLNKDTNAQETTENQSEKSENVDEIANTENDKSDVAEKAD